MSDLDGRTVGAPRPGRTGQDPDPRLTPARRPCPCCAAAEARAFDRSSRPAGQEGAVVRCSVCSLVFVDPVPRCAVTTVAYGAEYYEPWQERREERARIRMWRRRLSLLETRRGRSALLDVGCGDGLFLKVARDAGWSVEGIEFSPEGARRSSQRLGRPVAVGDLASASGLRGPFDVVTLWHVLEHLVSPTGMLDAARLRLRPGGLLVAAVPNLDNLLMRAAYRVARGRPLPLFEEDAREPHLSHFSPDTLRDILERRGFEEIELRADLCALTPAKRAIDALAFCLSPLCGRLLTDAIVAFARRLR
jgi:SAM-dependent methyltransferase